MSENKRNIAAEAELRASIYNKLLAVMTDEGYTYEPIKGGSLVTIDENTHIKISVSICDESKVPTYIEEYAEQQMKNAIRAQEAAARAEEKARKAAERAEKKAKKDAE